MSKRSAQRQGCVGAAGAAQRPERSGAWSSPVPRSGSPRRRHHQDNTRSISRLFFGHTMDASAGAGWAQQLMHLSTETVHERAR